MAPFSMFPFGIAIGSGPIYTYIHTDIYKNVSDGYGYGYGYSLGEFAKLTVVARYRRTQRHARPLQAHGRQGHHAGMCRRQVSVWRQGFESLQGNPI